MEEKRTTQFKHVKHGHGLLVSLMVIIAAGCIAGWFLYHNQYGRMVSLTNQDSTLTTKLSKVNAQLSLAKAAGNITTKSWITYCDPHGIFCFKYPSGWTINTSYSADVKIGGATLTNPNKSLTVNYLDNYIKDDFPANFIIHSISDLNVSNDDLAVMGGYYIESVEHTPDYQIVNISNGSSNDFVGEPSSSDKPGENVFAGAVPIFEYNYTKYGYANTGEFIIQPTGQNFLSTQQANAWFNSIDGKTAYLIASSLYLKQ
jgi:hypothetical protein